MHNLEIPRPSFAGHESFPLRFAWLKKGFDLICEDPEAFGADDAMVTLGVGKNMVRAIRHWGMACQIWDEVPKSRGREMQPTQLGRLLFSAGGWDPYLEDLGSIWLLHWLLVTNLERATTWTWAFSRPHGNRFTREELVAELREFADAAKIRRVPDSTLKRDISVMLRSYLRPKRRKGVFGEDALDCPFVLLGLVREGAQKGTLEIVQGPHPTLPLRVFEYALADYATAVGRARRALTLDDLLYAPCSPGRAFRLSENALVHRLNDLVRLRGDRYIFDETAGLRQLIVSESIETRSILDAHYRTKVAA